MWARQPIENIQKNIYIYARFSRDSQKIFQFPLVIKDNACQLSRGGLAEHAPLWFICRLLSRGRVLGRRLSKLEERGVRTYACRNERGIHGTSERTTLLHY